MGRSQAVAFDGKAHQEEPLRTSEEGHLGPGVCSSLGDLRDLATSRERAGEILGVLFELSRKTE